MRPVNSAHPAAFGKAAEHAAWTFYLIAALGSTIGQIWVGVQTPPWPDTLPIWARALMVAPFAIVIDLGGVVCSAFADARQRLGESAYGWRVLSAASVTVGVGINILGHGEVVYLAVVFGGLGVFAYTVWLLHSGARRRDALRAQGKLADTPPVYGVAQWWREPAVTRRAKALAAQHRLGLHESLTAARNQLRDDKRRAALGQHIETLIRSRHRDPVRALIAATTLDIDAVAAALTAQADVGGWAHVIGADLLPPAPPAPAGGGDTQAGQRDTLPGKVPGASVLRQVPTTQADYDRWRQLWQHMRTSTELTNQQLAVTHGISARTAQRIREAGAAGLLDSPDTPVARIAALAQSNGHQPLPPAPAP